MATQETTVLDYFRRFFPLHVFASHRDGDNLRSMPLDSNCGSDCKKAIDGARKLIIQLDMAYGTATDPDQHPRGKEYRGCILNASVSICNTFICG